MKLVLLLLVIVFTGEVFEAAPLINSELVNSLTGNSVVETDDKREGRSSPVGSIAGYITSYQERKILRQKKLHYIKNLVDDQKNHYDRLYSINPKKPVHRPKHTKSSYYQKNRKHCFYGHIFVKC